MNRSLAELAPRNAVVALEGAVRDLTDRVALLRREGERELLLAPLEVMAAELRASLKTYDPQATVAGLQRGISALSGRVEALADLAINPERFDCIQRQTEEVRDLLAAAVSRSAPLERLERRIGELADRIEVLGASPAPQLESVQMAASLADLRSEIERSTPLSVLIQIERRLEHIAARLDDETVVPAQEGNPHALEDLAQRIDDALQSLNASFQAKVETGALELSLKEISAKLENPSFEALIALVRNLTEKLDSGGHKDREVDRMAIEPKLAEIVSKLDRLHHQDLGFDLRSIGRLLQSLDAKLDAGRNRLFDDEAVGQIAEAVAQRVEKEFSFRLEAQGLAEQITSIRDRVERLSGLEGIQELLRMLSAQLASLGGEFASENEEQAPPSADRMRSTGSSTFAVRAIEALETIELSSPVGVRSVEPALPANEDLSPLPAGGDVLLEPGAGAPNRIREAREGMRDVGAKTNPSISIHIAAARRAAHSALAEGIGHEAPAADPAVGRGIERAKSLYSNHKRSVLLVATVATIALAAVRFVGLHAPVVQKSDLNGHQTKTAMVDGSSRGQGNYVPTPATAPKVDPTPTASIEPPAAVAKANSSSGIAGSEISASISAALPTSLRDAVVAERPSAEYELAQRLFEGRGVPQDQHAAAVWFERAASSGLAPAQFRLATLYSKGVGVSRDSAAAKRWYVKAAEAGNVRAAHNLAVIYAEPVGEPPDYVEAAKWFRKAAEFGVRDSQFNLAVLYARGLGVDQDLRQSWIWFSLAAAQGDADAAKKRDELAAKMAPDVLAAAASDLAKFAVAKSDPVANEVAAPPGGWDEKSGVPALGRTAPASPDGGTSVSPP